MKLKAFILLLFVSVLVVGQHKYFTTLEVPKAFKARTRSADGTPGETYWQNGSDYTLKAVIEPDEKSLSGTVHVVYHNNSPDTLNRIVMRMYQDFYKKGAARDLELKPETITDGIDLTKFAVNDSVISVETDRRFRRRGTNLYYRVVEPLLPGQSLNIDAEWNFFIPTDYSVRMGAFDETSYLIAYWYPQMSVYDDVDGWDVNQYVGHEFYNDFSNYEVEVVVPENFVVWATGVLQNPEAVLAEAVLERYEESQTADSVINIITVDNLESGEVTKQMESLSYKYKAENVPDFVFGVSDHYLWDGASVVVNDETGRRTVFGAAYKMDAPFFDKVAGIAGRTLEYLSKELPAVPYPWPRMTVFNGSGGMEFPMMVNDGAIENYAFTVSVTSHEISHSYAPFYFGINERKYSWMDEGWATFIPADFQNREQEIFDAHERYVGAYQSFAGRAEEMPMMIPSILMSARSRPFGVASYQRPGTALNVLRDYLGAEKFTEAIQEFAARWHEKHPIPYDLFNTLEDFTGEDLSWFIEPWYFERGYPNLALAEVNSEDSKIEVVVKNPGTIPVTAEVTLFFDDDSKETQHKTAEVWKDGADEVVFEFDTFKKLIKVVLGSSHIPDVDKSDNVNELVKVVRTPIELTEEQLAKYVGKYKLSDDFVVSVRADEGSLYADAPGQGESKLTAYSLSEFEVDSGHLKINFEFDAEGNVTRLLVMQGGMNLPINKVK